MGVLLQPKPNPTLGIGTATAKKTVGQTGSQRVKPLVIVPSKAAVGAQPYPTGRILDEAMHSVAGKAVLVRKGRNRLLVEAGDPSVARTKPNSVVAVLIEALNVGVGQSIFGRKARPDSSRFITHKRYSS